MKFPYPITPELLTDLRLFFDIPGPSDLVSSIEEVLLDRLRPYITDTFTGNLLVDMPFGRAFMEWRDRKSVQHDHLDDDQCYAIISALTREKIGVTHGEAGKLDVLSEEPPDTTFIPINKSECPMCSPLDRVGQPSKAIYASTR